MGGNTSDLNPQASSFVNEQVSSDCVVIFSKTTCPYCRSAKQVFKNLGVSPTVIELDRRSDGSDIQDVLANMTGARTVPRVFVNGKCIGGNSETQTLNKNGQLQTLVQGCTAQTAS